MPTPVAIAVVFDDDRVLIGPRGTEGTLAGFWEFPGGKINADESPATAAARECREETGLAVEVGDLLDEREHHYAAHDDREAFSVSLSFFACQLCDQEETSPRAPFRWVCRSELDQYEFPAANDEVLKCLRKR